MPGARRRRCGIPAVTRGPGGGGVSCGCSVAPCGGTSPAVIEARGGLLTRIKSRRSAPGPGTPSSGRGLSAQASESAAKGTASTRMTSAGDRRWVPGVCGPDEAATAGITGRHPP